MYIHVCKWLHIPYFIYTKVLVDILVSSRLAKKPGKKGGARPTQTGGTINGKVGQRVGVGAFRHPGISQ